MQTKCQSYCRLQERNIITNHQRLPRCSPWFSITWLCSRGLPRGSFFAMTTEMPHTALLFDAHAQARAIWCSRTANNCGLKFTTTNIYNRGGSPMARFCQSRLGCFTVPRSNATGYKKYGYSQCCDSKVFLSFYTINPFYHLSVYKQIVESTTSLYLAYLILESYCTVLRKQITHHCVSYLCV